MKKPFWNYLKDTKIEALICEGTQYGHISEPHQEIGIAGQIEGLINSHKNQIVFAAISGNDLFRLKVLQDCGRKTGRTPVVSDGNFIKKIRKLKTFMKSKDQIADLLQEVSFRELCDTNCIPSSGTRRIERLREIESKPGQFLVISPSVKDLFDILFELPETSRGGCCILSLAEYFEEELGVKTEEVVSELSRIGLDIFRAHSPGHAFPCEIAHIVKTLKPKKVFLLHTDDPVNFKNFLIGQDVKSQIICPREEEVFEF